MNLIYGCAPDVKARGRRQPAGMPRYLLHHTHDAAECSVAFASFKGHASPLRHATTIASCLFGGHTIWWLVDAPSPERALELLPFFVAQRSTAVEVREVQIP
jgi:hypothetical protein